MSSLYVEYKTKYLPLHDMTIKTQNKLTQVIQAKGSSESNLRVKTAEDLGAIT